MNAMFVTPCSNPAQGLFSGVLPAKSMTAPAGSEVSLGVIVRRIFQGFRIINCESFGLSTSLKILVLKLLNISHTKKNDRFAL